MIIFKEINKPLTCGIRYGKTPEWSANDGIGGNAKRAKHPRLPTEARARRTEAAPPGGAGSAAGPHCAHSPHLQAALTMGSTWCQVL